MKMFPEKLKTWMPCSARGLVQGGVEGKDHSCKIQGKPGTFLRMHLGMQMVIEYTKNVIGWKDTNSTMDTKTPYPVIALEQIKKGGTGAGNTQLAEGGLAMNLWQNKQSANHRHRWEFNSNYLNDLLL